MTSLSPSKVLGAVDPNTITEEWAKPLPTVKASSTDRPPLETLLNTHDFVTSARQSLTAKAWAFYSSAATDLHTKTRNSSAYADIGLRPRILTDVRLVDTRTTMLGQKMSVPIFCAPAAMAKLAHPDGEKAIARGCRAAGIPQCVSTSASLPIAEIMESVGDPGRYCDEDGTLPVFFQLYVDKQREKSKKLLKQVEELGVKAIFVTVDAPVAGKREADERIAADESLSAPMSSMTAKNDAKGGALGRIMAGYIDASLSWDDLPWLRRCTKLPIVLKGVQTAMDATKAMENGIDGILLSNHGGRSLDTSPAPILILLELQKCCPEVFDKMEVYVDGGIMRGTDIFKALCLGAKSVGIGRGLLYALNYGPEGVEKYVESKSLPLSFLLLTNKRP
jgi:L-lactate dehydrogenase (cytochrome)